jgi:hypothetical protein
VKKVLLYEMAKLFALSVRATGTELETDVLISCEAWKSGRGQLLSKMRCLRRVGTAVIRRAARNCPPE